MCLTPNCMKVCLKVSRYEHVYCQILVVQARQLIVPCTTANSNVMGLTWGAWLLDPYDACVIGTIVTAVADAQASQSIEWSLNLAVYAGSEIEVCLFFGTHSLLV